MSKEMVSIHERIQYLLEEMNDAFINSGGGNMDYAGFAAMALSDFKALLDNPELTAHDLRNMLRKGGTFHRDEGTEEPWSSFMARYVAQNANLNQAGVLDYSLETIYKQKA